MHHVEVLGFDCAACRKTFRLVEQTARELEITIRLEKVDDPARILAYRVLKVPAVAVDGILKYSGGIPPRGQIKTWLATGEEQANT